ncbi:hypothetical protein FRC11_010411 [Ceratobasidium sp. 423]|nr:hypothetical protein FRC11_010411 [Ceratobasidium sp. 423]
MIPNSTTWILAALNFIEEQLVKNIEGWGVSAAAINKNSNWEEDKRTHNTHEIATNLRKYLGFVGTPEWDHIRPYLANRAQSGKDQCAEDFKNGKCDILVSTETLTMVSTRPKVRPKSSTKRIERLDDAESRVTKAIERINEDPTQHSQRKAHELFNVGLKRLQNHMKGVPPRPIAHARQQLMTPSEERVGVDFILSLADHGFPITMHKFTPAFDFHLTVTVQELLNPETIAYHFEKYESVACNVARCNIFNMDEKGGTVGEVNRTNVLVRRSTQPILTQDGNRENVTILELYAATRDEALTIETILKSFEATGLVPFNPDRINLSTKLSPKINEVALPVPMDRIATGAAHEGGQPENSPSDKICEAGGSESDSEAPNGIPFQQIKGLVETPAQTEGQKYQAALAITCERLLESAARGADGSQRRIGKGTRKILTPDEYIQEQAEKKSKAKEEERAKQDRKERERKRALKRVQDDLRKKKRLEKQEERKS